MLLPCGREEISATSRTKNRVKFLSDGWPQMLREYRYVTDRGTGGVTRPEFSWPESRINIALSIVLDRTHAVNREEIVYP